MVKPDFQREISMLDQSENLEANQVGFNLINKSEESQLLSSIYNISIGIIVFHISTKKILFINQYAETALLVSKENFQKLDKYKLVLSANNQIEDSQNLLIRLLNVGQSNCLERYINERDNINVFVKFDEIKVRRRILDSQNSSSDEDTIRIMIIEKAENEGFAAMKTKIIEVLKTKFLITISHELNNPMSSLNQVIESLTKDNPTNLKDGNEAKFLCGYINFFIKILVFTYKMNFKESIRLSTTNFSLGSLFVNIMNSIKKLIKQQKIQIAYPNIDEFDKIQVQNDYDAFEILVKALFIYLKTIVNKKSSLSVNCTIISDSQFKLSIVSQTNPVQGLNYMSSGVHSGAESSISITNSVATSEILKNFVEDFSKVLMTPLNIKKSDENIMIELIFKGSLETQSQPQSTLNLIPVTSNKSVGTYKFDKIEKPKINKTKSKKLLGFEFKKNIVKNSNKSLITIKSLKSNKEEIVVNIPYNPTINNQSSNEEFSNNSLDNNDDIMNNESLIPNIVIEQPEEHLTSKSLLNLSNNEPLKRYNKKFETFGKINNTDKFDNCSWINQDLCSIRSNETIESLATVKLLPENFPITDLQEYITNIKVNELIKINPNINEERKMNTDNLCKSPLILIKDESEYNEFNSAKPPNSYYVDKMKYTDNLVLPITLNPEIRQNNRKSTIRKTKNNILTSEKLSLFTSKLYDSDKKNKESNENNVKVTDLKKKNKLKSYLNLRSESEKSIKSNQKNHICSQNEFLIVDDVDMIRDSLKKLLLNYNLVADEAENGKEAIEKIVEKNNCLMCSNFKIIFMDIMMPVMDGISACKELENIYKDWAESEKPKIVIISAHDTLEIFNMTKAISIVKKFLNKPVSKNMFSYLMKELNFCE